VTQDIQSELEEEEDNLEYIALAISKTEIYFPMKELELKAENFDLKLVVQDESEIDSEVREGLLSFIKSKNLMLIQFVK
jgi:hypothetical protein